MMADGSNRMKTQSEPSPLGGHTPAEPSTSVHTAVPSSTWAPTQCPAAQVDQQGWHHAGGEAHVHQSQMAEEAGHGCVRAHVKLALPVAGAKLPIRVREAA